MIKPGWKTTEFWAAQALTVLLVIGQAVDVTHLPAPWAAVFIVALQVGYAVSRGLAKHGAPVDILAGAVAALVAAVEGLKPKPKPPKPPVPPVA